MTTNMSQMRGLYAVPDQQFSEWQQDHHYRRSHYQGQGRDSPYSSHQGGHSGGHRDHGGGHRGGRRGSHREGHRGGRRGFHDGKET